jgi:hypothetical protein
MILSSESSEFRHHPVWNSIRRRGSSIPNSSRSGWCGSPIIVGRENVLAGTDCGFAQSPFAQRVHPTIMWAKLRSLADGARLASAGLWGRKRAA